MAKAATGMDFRGRLLTMANPTIGLAVGLMAIIIVMVLPMPSWVLDIGLTLSFAFAILIFTLTLFIERPLDFSSFPAVLLASLLLRLSLNIASTKLIIGNGHEGIGAAGGVIEGFAMFVMGGNVFIGLIVFCVLVIVNFMVITKGAGRMAEVGARFALDAMPGKQMAIDADLAAGAISHDDASRRRTLEQEETAFLGSLDGVSKFMKGDAVAGILITLLNLVAGIAIGLGVHGISLTQALTNYSILTVGDGLVSQIPAVIISIAAGLLLSKGRGEGTFDLALTKQFTAHPQALMAVAGILAVFACLPGLPFLPFTCGAIVLGYAGLRSSRGEKNAETENATNEMGAASLDATPSLGDALDLDAIHVEMANDLVALTMDDEFGFDKRIEKIRRYVVTEFGFILPPIRLTDSPLLESESYRILIDGYEVVRNRLRPQSVLALMESGDHLSIPGETTKEPVYGAPARWVDTSHKDALVMSGVPTVDAVEVLTTHLLETVQANFSQLLTRRALRETLETFKTVSDDARADSNRRILDEFLPDKVPLETLQGVMRLLLKERISVRNLPVILETIAEARTSLTALGAITDHVRLRLAPQFLSKLRNTKGNLPIIKISQDWENCFSEHEVKDPNGQGDIALPPDLFNRLAADLREQLDKAASQGNYAVVAVSARRRRFLRTILDSKGVQNPVVAYEEVLPSERPIILGTA